MKRKLLRIFPVALIIGAGFFWGAITVAFKIPPYQNMVAAYARFQDTKKVEGQGEWELLRFAFMDPMPSGGSYFPFIRSLGDLAKRNQDIFVRREWFSSAFESMIIGDVEELIDQDGRSVIKVPFQLGGGVYESFAYGSRPANCGVEPVSTFVIPGSGFNQGVAIADRDADNYHAGIYPVLNQIVSDTFIFIKPNEGFLSWTDGSGRKVTGDFVFNWHLNRGGSYSVSYLTQALALQKYLASCYEETIVAGLSQGGFAALVIGLQSKPTLAIVASGYSVISEHVEWSGRNQIIGVPDQSELYRPSVIKQVLSQSPTSWFFTWGRDEVGTFRIEAQEEITAKVFEAVPNVKTSVHKGGHQFPTEQIVEFLRGNGLPFK